MRRDAVDFAEVRPQHIEIHDQLINWARWVRPGRGGNGMLPMFHGYQPYLYPEVAGGGIPIDSLQALATERAVAKLPVKHAAAIRWAYVYPFILPHRVRQQLGLTSAALSEMLHDSRAMLRNTV